MSKYKIAAVFLMMFTTFISSCFSTDRSDPDGTGYLSNHDLALQERKAANNDAEAMRKLRIHYSFVGNSAQSYYWFERSAKSGDLTAMREMGIHMCNSKDLDTKKLGWQWLVRASEAGHKDATKSRIDLICKAEIFEGSK